MKKRIVLLVSSVLLILGTWESGVLQSVLWSMGERVALSALSRSLVPGDSFVVETGQGYEEGLFVAPAPKETQTQSKSAPVVNLSINNGKYKTVQGVALKNGTSKSVDVAAMLESSFQKPDFTEDAPAVLIYHTHTTECYAEVAGGYSDDGDVGVIGVGEEMKKVFEAAGLKTIHLTDNFMEGGPFKKAYTRSLAGVEAVLKKYPTIQIVLDIHRDSITEGDTEYCPMSVIDGKEYAQIMVISGTDDLGLSHAGWKKNLGFALRLVKTLQEDYAGLSRPLNLNANRYNTHTTPYALLIEVGGGANTADQAKRSGRAVAESICKIVN